MNPNLINAVLKYRDEWGDLYLFSGAIEGTTGWSDRKPPETFIDLVCGKQQRAKKASVFLTTYGGDPHVAYRMAKCLLNNYEEVRVLIAGPCKSAGTLLILGAHSIGFSHGGQLGPLDIQLTKPDEILPLSSGLDIFEAVQIVTDSAFESFENYLVQLTTKSGGAISTRTAAEIATQLVTGLFQPITGQIDPLRLGENQRATKIATAYGERLAAVGKNVKAGAIVSLVQDYPSHGFSIDHEEAKKLFERVEWLTEREAEILDEVQAFVRYPSSPQARVWDLTSMIVARRDADAADKAKQAGGSAPNPAADSAGKQGASGTVGQTAQARGDGAANVPG